VGETDRIGDVA
jgi:hypothetical protein